MKIEPDDITIVKKHMARSFYAQDWADWAGRAGFRYRQAMDHIPHTAPASYHVMVEKAIAQLEKSAKLSFAEVITVLACADNAKPDSDWLAELGHDLGMMATGTGVSWFDDHERPEALPPLNMHVENDGIGWDMPDEWYGVPTIRFRFKTGEHDCVFKFPAGAKDSDVFQVIVDECADCWWPDHPLTAYTIERLA